MTDAHVLLDLMQILDGGLLACTVYVVWGNRRDRRYRAVFDAWELEDARDEARAACERYEAAKRAHRAAPVG